VVTNPPCYGHHPEEIALRQRLLAAGLSLFEPDPLGALTQAESARRDAFRMGDAL
jgi:hypothetical protein